MRRGAAATKTRGMILVPLLAAAALAPAPVQLGAADTGRAVTLSRATPVVVTLVSNPSTGFRWKLLVPLDKRVVKLVSHRYVAPASTLVGASGHEVWRFRTVGRGTAALRLGYVRPWAPADVERRFGVVFRVRP